MQERYTRGELAKEILMLFVAGGLVATCVVLPGMAHILKLMDAFDSSQKDRVRQAVRKLEKRKILVRTIENGKETFAVSKRGKRVVLGFLLEDLEITRAKTWDRKWRILMFDIPEKNRSIRRDFSFNVKAMGMYALQDSVFVTPFPCKKQVDFLTQFYGIGEYVVYLESNRIECRDDLLKTFSLRR